jgi:hypothetical protein
MIHLADVLADGAQLGIGQAQDRTESHGSKLSVYFLSEIGPPSAVVKCRRTRNDFLFFFCSDVFD